MNEDLVSGVMQLFTRETFFKYYFGKYLYGFNYFLKNKRS
jgi:hypothetical protein